jgi:hypothetical protein
MSSRHSPGTLQSIFISSLLDVVLLIVLFVGAVKGDPSMSLMDPCSQYLPTSLVYLH